jgi:predicted RNA-binding Zn ribbon-like protein
MSGDSASPAKPLFLAGHLALDFLNTTMSPQGTEIELIGDGRAFVDWLVAAEVLDAAAASRLRRQVGAEALDELAAEARKLRGWTASWIARWRDDPEGRYDTELRRLNAVLERAGGYPQLAQRSGRFELVEQRRGETTGELLAAIAQQIAGLLVSEQAALVKRCDGAQCTLWFVDRTKAHSRRFCSASVCGNRDKVAAFRARMRRPGMRRPSRPSR